MAGEGGGESEVDLVDADRCRQVDLGVPQVELEVLTVLRQARIVRAGAVRRDLSRGHRRDGLRARAGRFLRPRRRTRVVEFQPDLAASLSLRGAM